MNISLFNIFFCYERKNGFELYLYICVMYPHICLSTTCFETSPNFVLSAQEIIIILLIFFYNGIPFPCSDINLVFA